MTIAGKLFAGLLALVIAAPVFAQAQRTYSQPELDQMLAPIALYPDPLLSQVLMAATYPAEVDQAAAWSRANPGLQGDDAVRAVQYEAWDPSVKSLVAFPQILARMYENPGWTRSLGDAFLRQERHVMDTVQQLRRRAQAAGNLQSSEQMQVQQQGQVILVQPASSQYVYVPYYDPLIVYGTWWWPAYRPIAWAPWPRPARVYLSLGFFFGDFDWHRRHVRVVHPTAYYYRPLTLVNRTVAVTPHRWQHEPRRLEAFAQRRPALVQQQRQVQPQVQRQENRAAATADRQDRRGGPQQQWPQSQPQVNALPSAQIQPAVQAQPSIQARPQLQRQERRVEQRVERREERQAARVQAPAPVQAQPQARIQAQPQIRQAEQRPSVPAVQAPQTPRADRQEQRHQRREQRQERLEERGHKAG